MRIVSHLPLLLLLAACNEPADMGAALPSTDPVEDAGEAADDDAPVGEDAIDAAAAADHRVKAISAYNAGKYDVVISETKLALEADPTSNGDRYNLACGYALNGQPELALAQLRDLLERGVDYGAALDSDFASLHDNAEFMEIVAAFEGLHPVVNNSERLMDVSERVDLAPQGLAFDAKTGRTFVSSMRTGEIWAIDKSGASKVFATLQADGTPLSAFGLEVDAARGTLWAVGSAFSLHEKFKESHKGTTALFALDLATGAVKRAYPNVDEGGRIGYNDIAVAPDGTVYLSGGQLHVLRPGAEAPVLLGVNPPPFRSTNGITLGPDPGLLYVAANRSGVARIEVATGEWDWVESSGGVDLRSFDGLYSVPGGLVGIQLGLDRWRAVRVDLDKTGGRVIGHEVLEQGNPDIAFATNGDIIDDHMIYVGRAPLEAGADRTAAGPAGGRTVIWSVPIRPNKG
jgi:hypothetical protein